MKFRFSIRTLLWLTLVTALTAGWLVDRIRLAKQLNDPVPAADLMRRVQIKGELGKPLWELMTVQGTWRDRGPTKGDDLKFDITHVDGSPVAKPKEALYPKAIWNNGEPAVIRGVKWDWNVRTNAYPGLDPPKPLAGETWELYGFETGGVRYYSSEIISESNLNAQMPGRNGFVTNLIYIRMRRLPTNDGTLAR